MHRGLESRRLFGHTPFALAHLCLKFLVSRVMFSDCLEVFCCFFLFYLGKKISVLPSAPADTNTGLETRGSTCDSLCIAFKNLAPPLCGFSQPDSCLLMLLWRYFVLGM